MSLNNDRLFFDKGREDNKSNISLVLASTDSKKIQKEKIDEKDSALSNLLYNKQFLLTTINRQRSFNILRLCSKRCKKNY